MLISWGSTPGQQDDCQLWLRDPRNGSVPRRHALTKGQFQHLLHGLTPGRNYSVSLSCVAGPYWSSTKPLAVAMGGYAQTEVGGVKHRVGWITLCVQQWGAGFLGGR